SLKTYANRLYPWPFHHKPVSQRDRGADGRNLRVPTDDGNEMGLSLAWRIRQHFPDKAIQSQFDAGGSLLRALHVGQPAESKVCIFHSDSFFSCVRTWVFPLAKTSVSS